MTLFDLFLTLKGSSKSGNRGHSGRPGKRGGSSPSNEVPSEAIKGVNLDENYQRRVSETYENVERLLNEWHSYGVKQDISIKDIPTEPSKEDLNWAENLDLYHRSKSDNIKSEGLRPSSETGKVNGSRYYDEPLGRTKAVFLSMGSLNKNLDYGANVASIKAKDVLNRPNTLVGKDIGNYPAEGGGPGIKAYKKDLLKGSDALQLMAYERTLDKWVEEKIYNRTSTRPFVPTLGGEVMYFGSISSNELTF